MSIASELERRRQRTLSADRFEATALNAAADTQRFWLGMKEYANDERVAYVKYIEEIIAKAQAVNLTRAPGESIPVLAERLDNMLSSLATARE